MSAEEEPSVEDKNDKALDKLLAHTCLSGTNVKAEDAPKFSQAVLNLAHAKQLLAVKK